MPNGRDSIRLSLFILILLCESWPSFVKAQDTFSPQLIQFLESHPVASCTLSNEIMKVKGPLKKQIEIFYFYTNDHNASTAHHNMFANGSEVAIFVLAGREPLDEYFDILFEILNANGDKRFQELYQQAMNGSITRSNFVSEILRQEFRAVKTLQGLIPRLGLTAQELSESKSYEMLSKTPDDFDKFITYSENNSQGSIEKLYEQYYDEFRRNVVSEKLLPHK